MATALQDIDGLFIAALCVVRLRAEHADASEEEKKRALETLLAYGRGAVSDAKEGHEGVWRVTARYLFGHPHAAPDTGAETEHPDQSV